jgi:hypothetical protein
LISLLLAVVREVFDEGSGRVRLIRGEGEVIEQIVSKQRQAELRNISTSWVAPNYTGKEKWPSQHPLTGYK